MHMGESQGPCWGCDSCRGGRAGPAPGAAAPGKGLEQPEQHGTEGSMQIQLRLIQVLIISHQLSSCPARQGTGSCCSLCREDGFALAVCPLCLSPCPQPAATTLL